MSKTHSTSFHRVTGTLRARLADRAEREALARRDRQVVGGRPAALLACATVTSTSR